MTTAPLTNRALALLLTLVVEGLGMAAFSLLARDQRDHLPRNVLLSMVLNFVSHTIFWTTLPLMPSGGLKVLCGYEIVIVFVEGLIYSATLQLPPATAALLSLALNVASYVVGIAVWGWPG